ncbi:hypothetical protein DKX38_003986 [Salix brachista]|uniref:Uncharacterized protein n=1 Tax=Salix brachista TaxID=2182728 RepID=A0A5N5N9V8_9ROSI|nr:hypothetical protein DKX38_003986 [Salix brachista]
MSVVTPSIRKASDKPNFFSSKRINSCIIASQRSRVICSLIIASLVLIPYIDYPLLGINIVSSESIIASKPLYIVLLTDVTIVLGRLFRERGNHGTEESVQERMVSKEDGDNWVGAVKLLERDNESSQSSLSNKWRFRFEIIHLSISQVYASTGITRGWIYSESAGDVTIGNASILCCSEEAELVGTTVADKGKAGWLSR